jgi:predicted O-linked N-acetylglucosamine transferase (SPINDLY family)
MSIQIFPPLPLQVRAAVQNQLRLAVIQHQGGQLDAAEAGYRAVLALYPAHLPTLQMLGVLLSQTGRQQEGVELLRQVVNANPNDPAACNNLGNALRELGAHAEAAASFEQAIRLQPNFVDAWSNWGNALSDLQRYEDAVQAYSQALVLQPQHANALNNRASALLGLRLYGQALHDFDQSIQLQPQVAETYMHRAEALLGLGQYEAALESSDVALQMQPNMLKAYWMRVRALLSLKQYPAVAEACDTVLALDSDYPYAQGFALYARLAACDWRDYEQRVAAVREGVLAGKKTADPFGFLASAGNPADELACARNLQKNFAPTLPDVPRPTRHQHSRLRLAYLSADFHRHATAYLMAELFERHDRSNFEVYAYSFGPDDASPMRQRLVDAFEHFHDVTEWSDERVAQHIREQEIDIAIDLKGYTNQNRMRIFALRPAPIQVNYLGYPGTIGADYINYLVGDAIVTPPEHDVFYSEKVIRLPGSYQVNDRQREIAAEVPSREACGLPAEGFVFCCFNNNYKINPPVFDIWMRLLQRVPGSVLWLLQDNQDVANHLRAEALARGVDAQRLVFAGRAPLPEHLARHHHAGLFLDTLPVNAHTTASDALWAGLPVLTCLGASFAGRVAASLLHAVCLPELVTHDLPSYEALAYTLATSPGTLQQLKNTLAQQRGHSTLFDTSQFCHHLELAYQEMYRQRWQGIED